MKYSFKFSVLEGATDPYDYYAPVTFLEWYKQQSLVSSDVNEIFRYYKQYILEWGSFKKKDKQVVNSILRDAYIQVLREIVINYSTEEEKRFINNADFANPLDLDIILPFFIDKLKKICLFYANTREEVRTASIQHNLRGSNVGVENLIKKLIFDSARTTQIDYTAIPASFPPLSAIARGLSVYVEELYDASERYFNVNPLSGSMESDSTLRRELSTANLNYINTDVFIDFKLAVKKAIQEYPFFLETLGTNNFSVNPVLSGTELNLLKERDFIQYLSGGNDELKVNLLRLLAPKFTGTDFYYVSTGSTVTNVTSGLLFSINNTYSSPTLNFLNKQFPTTASVPNLTELYTEYQLGRFFLPQELGLLIHNTPDKRYDIDVSKLQPNSVYTFPDPNVIGNVSYNSGVQNTLVPLIYKIDVEWNKRNRSNQFAFGDVLSNSFNQLYFGYQSQSQDQQKQGTGFCRVEDNIQFWGGENQETWTNQDIWPGMDKVDNLSYENRQQSLLVNDLTPVYWGNDIYGNEYGVLKRIFPLKALSSTSLQDSGVLPGSNTVSISSEDYSIRSMYDRKYTIPGIFYFRGLDSTTAPASAALSAIFLRYPKEIQNEMSSSVLYFNMYYDTFVLETINYVIIDSVKYDLDSFKITFNNTAGFYFNKIFTNDKIEKFAGEWYSERDNTLYLCFINLLPYLSGSNYKIIYPSIYKTALTNINLEKIYPLNTTSDLSINAYSLSAGFAEPPQINLTKIEGVSFSRSEKKSLFNIAYLGKNLNGMPLFVNEQLKEGDWDIFLQTFNPRLFRPYYFIYDNNYSNPSMPFLVKYSGSVGGTIGGQFLKKGIVDLGFESDPGELTFLYADGVLPVQLNKPGTYIVQFDWESYLETSIFVGCSAYAVRKTGNNVIFNYGKTDAVYFDTYGEQSNSVIGFSTVYSTVTGVSSITPSPINILYDIFTIDKSSSYTRLSASSLESTNLKIDSSLYERLVFSNRDNLTLNDTTSGIGTEFFNVLSITQSNTGVIIDIAPNTNLFDLSSNNFTTISGGIYLFAPYEKKKAPVFCNVVRPTYPDASVLKFTLTLPVTTNQKVQFCDVPDTIFKNIFVTQTGAGSGVVFTDPYCLDCGDICYQQFPLNSTLSLIASSNIDSEFNRWIGGPCDGSQLSDCTFNVTNSYSITAVFDAIPYYDVKVASIGYHNYPSVHEPVGGLFSADTLINCPSTFCEARYRRNTLVALSCLLPLSGWYFLGWKGGQCEGIQDRNICTFAAEQDSSVSATYTRYFDHNLTVSSVVTAGQLVDYGYVYSTTPYGTYQINVSGNTSDNNPGNGFLSLTGTSIFNSLSNIGTPVALSAKTMKGFQFKEWLYEPTGLSNYISTKNDYLTINGIASNVGVSAVFDTGLYTLTIVFSGDGIGEIRNDDLEILSIAQDDNSPTTFKLLSGLSFTLFASAYPGNTILGLSSRDSSSGFGVSAIPIRFDDDMTVIVNLSAQLLYTLDIVRFGTTCGAVCSRPARINCEGTGPDCTELFVANTTVYIDPPTSPATCSLSAFFAGNALTYYYQAGPGIRFTGTSISEHQLGETFSISDGSLSLDPTGAPYGTGSDVLVSNGEVKIIMSDNRTVSAFFYNG